MKKVFLDSSVLFTAVNSLLGGSAKLFTLTGIQLITSPFVLTEVERNIRKKLQSHHLARFFMLAGKIKIISQAPDKTLVEKAKKVIVEKDAVILAEAKRAKTDILLTLDKKHFLKKKVKVFLAPQKIATPKMLLASL